MTHLRKAINIMLLLMMPLLLVQCEKDGQEYTRFRISQLFFSDHPIHFAISQKGKIKFKTSLRYGETIPYTQLPSGMYTIEIGLEGDRPLLSKQIGFGRGDTYTFVLIGLPLEGAKVNRTNLNTELKRIAQGEEAVTPNDYLPQLRILNDTFESTDSQAKIRWINCTPGTTSISARAINLKKTDTISFGSLIYPVSSSLNCTTVSNIKLEWSIGNKDRIVADTVISLKAKTLYTFIVGAKKKEFINNLIVRTLRTENTD